jgi:hypothetical protein
MGITNSVVAIYTDHPAAEAAVRKLTEGGFETKSLSVIGKGYHTEEKVVGFYDAGDRIRFWGARGAFWGGLWGLFLGGMFLTVPFVGHVVVLGRLAAGLVATLENAAVVGGLSALGAGLHGLGIPRNSVIRYEAAVRADGFLVMAHGTAAEIARAEDILAGTSPTQLDVHLEKATVAPVPPIEIAG